MPKVKGPSPQQIAQNLSSSDDPVAADTGFVMAVALSALAWFAVIPGVLGLRSRYGERYLKLHTAAFSWILVAVTCFATTLGVNMEPFFGQEEEASWAAYVGPLMLAAFSVMLGLRVGGVLLRRMRDEYHVHSFSDGDPWPLWYRLTQFLPRSLQDLAVRCVLEPLAALVAGSTLATLTGSRLLGLLAFTTSLGFFIQQVILQQEVRSKLLDAADAEIEAEQLRADRERLQQGASDPLAFAPPRARSALSSMDIRQLQAARAAVESTASTPAAG